MGRPKKTRKIISELKGVMRELSPLGIDMFTHCPFSCANCFAGKESPWLNENDFFGNPELDEDLFYAIRWEIRNQQVDKQVLISPYTEPYPKAGHVHRRTRGILKAFLKEKMPCAVLSKGGKNILKDTDVFQDFGKKIKVGATLITTNNEVASRLEKYAPSPAERMLALSRLKEAGVRTQVVMMPVLSITDALSIIEFTKDYTDEYFISVNPDTWLVRGRWYAVSCLESIVTKLRNYKKRFYVEENVRKRIPQVFLTVEESRRGDFFIHKETISGIDE